MRLAIVIVAVCWMVPARAETPEVARARVLYAEGRKAYDAGEYTRAIAAWKEGYGLSEAPMFLFNIGQAYRFAGDCQRARGHYTKYRAALLSPTNADELAEAESHCVELAPAPVTAAPIAVVRRDRPAAPSPWTARRIATWSLGGAGIVAVGVGLGFFGARSWSRWNEIEKLCGDDRHCDDAATLERARSFESDARSDGTKSTLLVGAGAAALITATVLHVTKPRGVTIAPSVEAAGVGMTAMGSF